MSFVLLFVGVIVLWIGLVLVIDSRLAAAGSVAESSERALPPPQCGESVPTRAAAEGLS